MNLAAVALGSSVMSRGRQSVPVSSSCELVAQALFELVLTSPHPSPLALLKIRCLINLHDALWSSCIDCRRYRIGLIRSWAPMKWRKFESASFCSCWHERLRTLACVLGCLRRNVFRHTPYSGTCSPEIDPPDKPTGVSVGA